MGACRVLCSGLHHPPSVLVLAALLLRGGGERGAAAGAEEGEARQSGAKQVGHHIAGVPTSTGSMATMGGGSARRQETATGKDSAAAEAGGVNACRLTPSFALLCSLSPPKN